MANLLIDWMARRSDPAEHTRQYAPNVERKLSIMQSRSVSRIPVELMERSGQFKRNEEICGELNPGFHLWTSAHGFHHFSLTSRRGWKRCWGGILLLCVVLLLICFIYYSYQTFSSAVNSRVSIESSRGDPWPVTVLCERAGYSRVRVARLGMGTRLASYLTWSMAPSLARPVAWDSQRLNLKALEDEMTTLVKGDKFKGNYNLLLDAIMPSCQEFIIQCQIGRGQELSGEECCKSIFNSRPFLTQHGTCFTTKGMPTFSISDAGEGSGLTVITQHDKLPLDNDIASPDLLSSSGVSYAVVDSNVSPLAAVRMHSHTVQADSTATIAITSSRVDDSDLEFSLIGLTLCNDPADSVDEHLNMNQGEFGYSRDNCLVGKEDLIATNIFGCSFILTNSSSTSRCFPRNSSVFADSFTRASSQRLTQSRLFRGEEGTKKLKEGENLRRRKRQSGDFIGRPTVSLNSVAGLEDKYSEECPKDCATTRYTVSPSITPLTESIKQDLRTKVQSGSGVNAVVLKFHMASTDYTKISNKSQPFLQFVAEVGGMMAFFLGLSVVTLIECCCYCGFWCRRKCTEDDSHDGRGAAPGIRPQEREERLDRVDREDRWTQQYKQELQQRAQELEERAAAERRYREQQGR